MHSSSDTTATGMAPKVSNRYYLIVELNTEDKNLKLCRLANVLRIEEICYVIANQDKFKIKCNENNICYLEGDIHEAEVVDMDMFNDIEIINPHSKIEKIIPFMETPIMIGVAAFFVYLLFKIEYPNLFLKIFTLAILGGGLAVICYAIIKSTQMLLAFNNKCKETFAERFTTFIRDNVSRGYQLYCVEFLYLTENHQPAIFKQQISAHTYAAINKLPIKVKGNRAVIDLNKIKI